VELRLRDGSGHCENFTNEFGMWQVGKPAASNIYVVPLSFSDAVGAVYQGANELEWTTCLTSIVRFLHSFYDRAYNNGWWNGLASSLYEFSFAHH